MFDVSVPEYYLIIVGVDAKDIVGIDLHITVMQL